MLWGALNGAEGVDLAFPAYAHLPLLVNEQGKKLSKRRDPVAVEMYREQGYLPGGLPQLPGAVGLEPRRRGDRPAGGADLSASASRTCSGHRPSSTSRS